MTRPLSPRLRVTVVSPVGELGGAETYLLRMLDATDRLDVDALLLRDGPLRAELQTRGVRVAVVDVGRTPAALAAGTLRVGARLRGSTAEVVLANGIKAQVVAGPAARALGIPCVWVKHDHSYDRWLTPALARLADRVVATADDVAPPTRRTDVEVIVPPRPADPLRRDQARSVLGPRGLVLDDATRYVAMLTRLTPYKGVDTAIRALAVPAAAAWHLVVFGGDDPAVPGERARLATLAESLGLGDRVHLLDHVADAPRLLSAFDALAVLTRSEGPRTPGREGFGMAAMEATIAGLPVVAPDDGGAVARRARDGAGLLVDATSPSDVASALGVLADDASRAAMAAEADRRAGQFPSAADSAHRLVGLLSAAAHRCGAGVRSGPAVSVVSPVLDEVAVLDRLVAPLALQLRDDDELLLVDSGSTDGTRELATAWSRSDPRIRLLEVDRCSIAASRNHGVEAAKHDVVVCTDAGCEPYPTWLDTLRASMALPDSPELAIGTYRAAVRSERLFEVALAAVAWPDPDELRRAALPVQLWLRTFGPSFSARRVDGRSVAFTKPAFQRSGGFPTSLATAEDEAFGRAMIAAGARAELVVDATVTWFQRESVALAFRQFRGYGRGGGQSRSPLLLANDGIRAAAYAGTLGLVAFGGAKARALAAAGVVTLAAFPARRILRRGQPARAIALVPLAQVVKDGGKLTGVLESLVLGRGAPLARTRRRQP
ncbi:MAG: glycosyltransferase [Nocardioidaceae bacterium]